MTNTQIRTEEQAINWLAENKPEIKVTEGVIVEDTSCWKCAGVGVYMHFGGCFQCNGRGYHGATRIVRTPVKKYAQAAKRAAKRTAQVAAKRTAQVAAKLERQRDWNEANGNGRITFDESDAKRAEERQARYDAIKAQSEHVGQIKERCEFELKIVHVATWETAYGFTYCYIMRDEKNNAVIWKASNAMQINHEKFGVDYDFGKGYTVRLKATIKDHSERDGEKQTVITRGQLVAVMVETAA